MFTYSPDFYSLTEEDITDAAQDVLGLTDDEIDQFTIWQLEDMLNQAYSEAADEANLRDLYTY